MSRNLNQQFANANVHGRPQQRPGGSSNFGGSQYGGAGPSGGSRPPPPPTFKPGTNLKGKSNAFEIKIQPKSIAFRYDVEIVKVGEGNRVDKSLTKQSDPGLRTVQKECCADIIECLHGLTGGFNNNSRYLYDGKNLLFTTEDISPINNYIIEPAQLKRRCALFVRNSNLRVTITRNERRPTFNYSQLDQTLVDADGQADHSVRMFLELATTQFVCNTDEYQRVSAGTIFETREFDLTDGMKIRVGVKKGVRVTAHDNQAKAFLIADMKRTAFFSTELLHDMYGKMVRNAADRNAFAKFFHGVRFVVQYDTSRTFIFDKLSDKNVNDSKYKVGHKSLPEFFSERRGVVLTAAHFPGVHPKQPDGNQVIYPLEVIRPASGQLIPVEKLNDQAIRRLLLENAVAPDIRMNYVNQHVRQIGTGNGADFLNNFGLKLLMDSNDIQITTSAMPSIIVGQNRTIRPQNNGSWFRESVDCHFIEGSGRLKNWIVVHDNQANPNDARNFVRMLINHGNRSGMLIPNPQAYLATDMHGMEQVFVKAKETKVQFILYTDPIYIKSHGKLKLLEAKYKILTQHVVAKNLQAGAQTVKNILMKMNIKCFGLNYMPVYEDKIKDMSPQAQDLLIIGYDIATPPSASAHERWLLKQAKKDATSKAPSVVGVCANRLKGGGFAGDFFYQQSRGDLVSPKSLEAAVERATEAACKNGRQPKRVLVLRDGVSEGRQENVANSEIPAIRRGVEAGMKRSRETANFHPKFTVIVATKEHFKRFFRNLGGPLTNTCPGDVINTKITRTDIPEFYVQSHHPLKGSPKIPQYAVIVNELDIPSRKLEWAMQLLSNQHQVCACPTSLPLPVYLAHETAKRGMEIFKAYEIYRHDVILNEVNQNELGMYDFKMLTELLGYYGSPLYGTRFNA